MISIIIPIYNINKYIVKCIDSVITIDEVEIIAVDDGSLEDTSFLIEKYSKYKNFNYYKKNNGGLSSARNYGIKKANKEYVMFLDGDDFIETNNLKKILKTIKKTKQDCYYYKYIEFYENKLKKEKWYIYDNDIITFKNNYFVKDPFLMVAWRYIIKKDIIIKNNLYFTENIYHEDEEWTPRLLTTIEKIYSLKMYLLYYRIRNGSIMHTIKYKNIIDRFKIIELLYKYQFSLKNPKKVLFIKRKCLELYRGIYPIVGTIELTEREKKHILDKLQMTREILEFDIKYKNLIAKYVPVRVILFLYQLRRM